MRSGIHGISCASTTIRGMQRRMADIEITSIPGGKAYLKFGDAEVRDSVDLSEHEEADRIPALDSLVLHFDFYGRLTAIEVTGSVTSVLPPALVDAARES